MPVLRPAFAQARAEARRRRERHGSVELGTSPQAVPPAPAAHRAGRTSARCLDDDGAALRDDRPGARERGRVLVYRAGTLGHDLGALIGPLNGDWWRVITSQFNYDNVGYLFAVGLAVAIFGTSLERRYGALVTLAIFLACGAAGMYLTTVIEDFPIALGGNGSALGLMGAWFVRDLRDRRRGFDTESDLLGVAAIAAVLLAMPLLERSADGWVALGGGSLGCVLGDSGGAA